MPTDKAPEEAAKAMKEYNSYMLERYAKSVDKNAICQFDEYGNFS